MTSLEWINAEIEKTKSYLGIAQCNEVMFGDENNEVYKMLKNQLTHLHQIKTILEAWEVVKNFIIDMGKTYVLEIDDWYCKNEYQTIKKALEV